MREWSAFKRAQPAGASSSASTSSRTRTTQAAEREDILNVGGFSDQVFDVVAEFAAGTPERRPLGRRDRVRQRVRTRLTVGSQAGMHARDYMPVYRFESGTLAQLLSPSASHERPGVATGERRQRTRDRTSRRRRMPCGSTWSKPLGSTPDARATSKLGRRRSSGSSRVQRLSGGTKWIVQHWAMGQP